MRFNLGKPTENEEYEIWKLKRSGDTRYQLDYIVDGIDYYKQGNNRVLLQSNNYDEIIQKLRDHYQSLLANDVSLITDFDIKDNYDIYDFAAYDDDRGGKKCITIKIADLNRQAFMHQFYGDVAKPVKKTAKKTSATKE